VLFRRIRSKKKKEGKKKEDHGAGARSLISTFSWRREKRGARKGNSFRRTGALSKKKTALRPLLLSAEGRGGDSRLARG